MKFAERFFLGMIILMLNVALSCGKGEEKQISQPGSFVDSAQVQKIIPVMVDKLYRSVGTIKSKNTAQISSKVMGYVSEIRVKEGDMVKEGDLLVVLQSKELEFRLEGAKSALSETERNVSEAVAVQEEAKAQLQLAEITFQRFKNLRARESVSQQEFDQANANYEVAKARQKRADEALASLYAKRKQVAAALSEAKTFYEYTHLRAPFAGLISQKMIDPGDLASQGTRLFVLEDNQQYQLEASVDESLSGKIKSGEEVEVSVDSLGEGKIKGRVAEIVPHIDSISRTFQVKIDLPLLQTLKSGMYGKAFFPVGKTALVLVPKAALVECGQLSSLFVVNKEGRVERRLVKEGKEYNGKIEILSGLDPGESIVARDVFGVKEGCLVAKKS